MQAHYLSAPGVTRIPAPVGAYTLTGLSSGADGEKMAT